MILDLFSGIGGFSLAAHSVGFSTVAFCEIEPYAQSVLRRHFPGVPIFDDVKELTADALADAERVRPIQRALAPRRGQGVSESRGDKALILTAGFPCQDISYAGKGAGLDGARSGLFYEVARLVGELRPDYVLLENVAALLTRGLDAVLGTLASLGFDAVWACVPACAVGAPHRRDRIWILAVPESPDSKQRLERIYAHVLSRLTPFGDLAEGWPTATASDAWASDKERNQTHPCTGRVLTGKAGLGHAAALNGTWPTPTKSDHKGSGPTVIRSDGKDRRHDRLDYATEQTWATPNHCDYKGSPSPAWSEQASLPRDVEQGTRDNGALNPDFVDALMGYPIGYTLPEGEPMTTLPNVWPAGLGAEQHEWEPPRLTTEKKHRASRLKCDGNSIVPAVARLWMEAIALDL